jgi:putative tricarboxylic transport membrane protein
LADRILAACVLVLAAAYLYATSTLPSFEVGDPLGPKAFPALLGILFAAAGILLIVEVLRARAAPAPAGPAPAMHLPAVAAVAAAMTALFALLEPLGYLVAITLFLFGLMRWLHRGRTATCLVVSVLFAVASYALFVKGLGVTLAKGVLHF